MPDSTSIGNMSAAVILDNTSLVAAVQSAQALIASLAKSLTGLNALRVGDKTSSQIVQIGTAAQKTSRDVAALAKVKSGTLGGAASAQGGAKKTQAQFGLTAYQKEFEANHVRSMKKSMSWSPSAISEWKAHYEQQQERGASQTGKTRQTATNSAATLGQSPDQKQVLRLTQQLQQGKLAWADYYTAIERLAQAHAAKMAQFQDRAAGLGAAMQTHIGSSVVSGPQASQVAAVNAANANYRRRMGSIQSLQSQSGLPGDSPEITGLKSDASGERDSRIAKANADYAKAIDSAEAALARFTTGLERSVVQGGGGSNDLPEARDAKIDLAQGQMRSNKSVIARLAQTVPGGTANPQVQQALGLTQTVYQSSVTSANQQYSKGAENAKLADLKQQFVQMEAAYRSGDESVKQYLSDLTALFASLKTLAPMPAQSSLLLNVSDQIGAAKKQKAVLPNWSGQASGVFGDFIQSSFLDSVTRTHVRSRAEYEHEPRRKKSVWGDFMASGVSSLDTSAGGALRQGASGGIMSLFKMLFGGHGKNTATVRGEAVAGADALTPSGTSAISSDIAKIRPQIQSAMGALTHGLSGVVLQAQALMSLSGAEGKQKQKSSLLGGILGGVAGSFVGNWFGGAQIGSAVGGMFANGGQMNMRKWNMVGEKGPELVAPGGTVVPLGKMSRSTSFGADWGRLSGGLSSGSSIASSNNVGGGSTSHFHGDIHVHVPGTNANANDIAWAIRRQLTTATAGI